MNKLFHLSFVPRSTDFGLLILRFWLGLTMFFHHGLPKITCYSSMVGHMPDPLHVGGAGQYRSMAILAEAVCAACVVIGIATRLAALFLSIELTVIFFLVHGGALSGQHSGELAFLYLAGFFTIVLAGGGRFVVCNRTNDVSGHA